MVATEAGRTTYRVAEAARLAGVSASTLRLWETQGLLAPQRTQTGQRIYSSADVALLKKIAYFRSERGLNPAAIREALEHDDTFSSPENGNDNVGRRLRHLRRSI